MNIMLVSVTERTMKWYRKALGAKYSIIVSSFFLSFADMSAGGILGVLIGFYAGNVEF
jgi:ABC-type antimicrobial peptide transport system permease subunit